VVVKNYELIYENLPGTLDAFGDPRSAVTPMVDRWRVLWGGGYHLRVYRDLLSTGNSAKITDESVE
jgi:hypothetical protein